MLDPVQSTAFALNGATAAVLAGLALLICVGIGRVARPAALRLGYGPVLGLTIVAASIWIALLALGAPGLPSLAGGNAGSVTMILTGLSLALLAAVFIHEGRIAPRDD